MGREVYLFTADRHLRSGDRIWARRPEIAGDGAFALAETRRVAEIHGVAGVLLGGDTFDVRPQRSDAISLAREDLAWYADRGIPVYYVQGQHELADPPILSAISDWPIHVHGRVFPGPDDLEFYGLDYVYPGSVQAALRAVPACDALLTHQVWRDFLGDDRGDALAAWCRAPHVLSGDYHQTVLGQGYFNDAGVECRLWSPGPPHLQAWGEPHDHCVFLLRSGPDGLEVERHEIMSRRTYTADVESAADLADLLPEVFDALTEAECDVGFMPEAVAKPCFRFRHPPDKAAEVRSAAEGLIGGRGHLFFQPLRPQPLVARGPATRAEKLDFEAAVRQAAPSESAAHDALRLLRAEDPLAEARAMLEEEI